MRPKGKERRPLHHVVVSGVVVVVVVVVLIASCKASVIIVLFRLQTPQPVLLSSLITRLPPLLPVVLHRC